MTDERTAGGGFLLSPEEWAELSLDQRRAVLEQAVPAFVAAYEKDHPRWESETLLRILSGAMDSLRRYLENEKDPGISWESPLVELHYAVEWSWTDAGPAVVPMPDEVLREWSAASEWLASQFLRAMDLQVMKLQTRGAAFRSTRGYSEALMAPDVQAAVDEMTEEEKATFFSEFGRPFIVGGDFLVAGDLEEWEEKDENGTPVLVATPKPEAMKRLEETEPLLPFQGDVDGVPFSGTIVFAIHPLWVDVDNREAFYPVTVGLQFNPLDTSKKWRPAPVGWERPEAVYPDPGKWSAEDRETFWAGLFSSLERVDEALRKGPGEESSGGGVPVTDTKPTTDTTSTMEVLRPLDATAARVVSPPEERTRFLTDSPTKISRETSRFLSHTPRIRLPRKWASIKKWDELVAKEVVRLQDTMGEAAFESRPGYPARLGKVHNGKTKMDEVILTKAGVADLEEAEGPRCFRKVEGGKEFLVKILQTRDGSGRVVFKTSWFGETWALSEEGLEDKRRELESLKEGAQGDLFEELPAKVQEAVDSRLRHLEHVRDALPLAEHIFRKFGGEGLNPVHFRASELWDAVLKCGDSPDRLARVKGALRALRELDYRLELMERGEFFSVEGSFLSTIVFQAKGTEDHRDGDFYLSISPAFIGGLRVFEVPGTRLRDLREVTSFEWRKKLPKAERKALAGFQRGVTRLAVPFYAAAGFTESQKALFRFIEGNLTRKKDPIQGHRKALKKLSPGVGEEPRPYGHEFCPFIPKGKLYSAALGAFRRSPEAGWTLYGTSSGGTKTGGGHAGGLLSQMGHPYPPGTSGAVRRESVKKALEDLRFVVEETLGGLVAARWNSRWFSLEDAKGLPENILVQKLKWFLFLPLDLAGRVREFLDAHNAERFEKGEAVHLWKVKPNPTAEAALTPEVMLDGEEIPAEADVVGPEGVPLWIRLRDARKKRKLSQAKVAALFGVIQQAVAAWERDEEEDEKGRVVLSRKPIPTELAPLVLRWVETGTPPTEEELASRRTRRTGLSKTST